MRDDADQWYFAYGSNLLAAQMIERTGPIRTEEEQPRRARLPNQRVVFNMLGSDGEIYANIEPAAHDVLGVVYRIGPPGLASLDEFEEGYERRQVIVITDDGVELAAIVYVSLPENVTAPRQPSEEYLTRIITGAREQGLPGEYIETLLANLTVTHRQR
ncbi:gamma-glutamylcyclotransferase family protein [Anatilimnocola floriformis]|uniref:gamma-glutamylcyclotransferase family protein n=1 Tax=Anatilimnocola floriformis TaxID=2948575 RepID=UPI0020C48B4A|nr:gamma-glutamylcyclotransferase family protein [Anatilimnocola floriformis]